MKTGFRDITPKNEDSKKTSFFRKMEAGMKKGFKVSPC